MPTARSARAWRTPAVSRRHGPSRPPAAAAPACPLGRVPAVRAHRHSAAITNTKLAELT